MTGTATPPSIAARPGGAPLRGVVRDLHRLLVQAGASCELVLPSGDAVVVGTEAPAFRLVFHTDRPFSRGLDERAIAEAYMHGEVDVEGDLVAAFELRHQLVDRVPAWQFVRIWLEHFFQRRTHANRSAINFHYQLGDEFYTAFLDHRFRIYTQGIYRAGHESLEDAAEHKMEQAFRKLDLRPGMRVLNVGAGWGATEQYFGSRGVHVTGLTIGDDSRLFVERLIAREQLTAEVRLEDFLVHEPAEPYDAMVIMGVIEHIPDYRRFAARVSRVLKPGGLMYLDACASPEKFTVGSFAREYIWTGTHTFMCLQDLIRELLYHGVDVLGVENETRHYALTCADWGRRFDEAHDFVASRWGESLWRAWRLYLWGAAHAFLRNDLQAYHLVARRGDGPGPRPRWARRAVNALKSIV